MRREADAAEIAVWIAGRGTDARVEFRARWPKFQNGQGYIPSRQLSITCAADRDPEALAREIARRLLVDFDPAYREARAYMGTLHRAGFVTEEGGVVVVTDAGLRAGGGEPAIPLSNADTIEVWRRALRAGERRMLDVLLEAHPHPMSLTELGERSGFEPGGTFRAYVGTLRRNGLAHVDRDQVRAGDALFLGAARKRR